MSKRKRKKFDYSPLKSPAEFRKMQQRELKELRAKQKRAKKNYMKSVKALRHFRRTGKWPRGYGRKR